jgi:hypothetical protein
MAASGLPSSRGWVAARSVSSWTPSTPARASSSQISTLLGCATPYPTSKGRCPEDACQGLHLLCISIMQPPCNSIITSPLPPDNSIILPSQQHHIHPTLSAPHNSIVLPSQQHHSHAALSATLITASYCPRNSIIMPPLPVCHTVLTPFSQLYPTTRVSRSHLQCSRDVNTVWQCDSAACVN